MLSGEMLRGFRSPNWMRGLLALTAVLTAGGLAACGSSDSGGSFTEAARNPSVSQTPPSSGCGSYDATAVKDPDGVVAALPETVAAGYTGYQDPVSKSPWQNWKPKGEPPYDVGVAWGQLSTDFQIKMTQNIVKTLKSSPLVGGVDLKTNGSNLDVAQQLQILNQMIDRHPDLIILQEVQPGAMQAAVDRAGRANIPVVVPYDHQPSKSAVNVTLNVWNGSALAASSMVRQMKGKGNFLWMHTIAGVGFENQSTDGVKTVLKNCPDIKVAGEGYGEFTIAGAKTQTLKLLATHPETIDAAYESSSMAPGVMSAFEQSGRPMPLVVDRDAMKGSVGFWRQNKDGYHGLGTGLDPSNFGHVSANVALRMLEGQGVKLTDILGQTPFITEKNLEQWAKPDYSLKTPGAANGPAGSFATDEQLNAYFANGSAPKSK